MPPWCRLGVCAQRGETIELLHDLLKFIFPLLKVKVTPDNRVLAREFNDFFAVKIVKESRINLAGEL